MTVTATLPRRRTEQYMRFGDTHVKHHDGSLDVVRNGARQPLSYAAGEWAEVEGDEKRWKEHGFWN